MGDSLAPLFGIFNNIFALFTTEIVYFFYRNGKYGQACIRNIYFIVFG